jgi:hypothetical protein
MTIIGIEGFRAAATALGLRVEAPDVSWWKNNNFAMLEGVVDGTRVLVQQGVDSAVAPWMQVYFHAALEPALDLGLKISLRGSRLAQAAPLTERDAALGSQPFYAAFSVEAFEPSRLQTFFTPALRAALAQWHNARQWERASASKNALELWISDESVIVSISTNALGYGFTTHPMPTDEIVRDVRATVALAKAMSDAGKHVLPAASLAPHAATWRTFASAHGLVLSESPLRMTGVFAGITFSARAALLGQEGYGVELTMPFARPLPFYLRLGPRCGWFEIPKDDPDARTEWARPQKTGDSAFDDALRVVSADEAAQNALLTSDLRRALLNLLESNEHVHMTTESISLRTKSMVSPDVFAKILRPLAEIEMMVDRSTAR